MQNPDRLLKLLKAVEITSRNPVAEQFLVFLELLAKWNARINLTASSDWKTLGPLFAEAIWAANRYPKSDTIHLDIGSGAGFPAIPMKLLRPQMSLDLVESRLKRAIFLETMIQALGLERTRVHAMRLDEMQMAPPRELLWDHVSWKAVLIGNDDLRKLWPSTSPTCEFWVFHGKGIPLESCANFTGSPFEFSSKVDVPGTSHCHLSIYRKHFV